MLTLRVGGLNMLWRFQYEHVPESFALQAPKGVAELLRVLADTWGPKSRWLRSLFRAW
jgi:hypothetical protein